MASRLSQTPFSAVTTADYIRIPIKVFLA